MTSNEPVLIWGTVGGFVGAILREFVPDLSGDFIQSVVEVITIVGPAVGFAFLARSKAFGPDTVQKIKVYYEGNTTE